MDQDIPEEARPFFENRGFILESCISAALLESKDVRGISAAFFAAQKPITRSLEGLKSAAPFLLDYDCRVFLLLNRKYARAAEDSLKKLDLPMAGKDLLSTRFEGRKASDPPHPYLRILVHDPVDWNWIANHIVEHSSVSTPNLALKIAHADLTKLDLERDELILLQRAYHDCQQVTLELQTGGKSGMRVFRAVVKLGDSEQWPKAQFVKIGHRPRISREYQNYELRVNPFTPFHLGPHLDRDRCCLGANKGIIVGDFVDESEDLHACASAGRASTAIACLFDKTLAGWHRQAKPVDKSVADLICAQFPIKVPAARLEHAKKYGATLCDLRELFSKCDHSQVLIGPIHGDLHSRNVRVRANDAVVIDFLAHRIDGMILQDAADLEASFLIDGFRSDGGELGRWLHSVQPLYGKDLFGRVSNIIDPSDKYYWFHSCVHQIRLHARQWELGENQYAGVLSFALLKNAKKDGSAIGRESDLRAYAYFFAEKIMIETFEP